LFQLSCSFAEVKDKLLVEVDSPPNLDPSFPLNLTFNSEPSDEKGFSLKTKIMASTSSYLQQLSDFNMHSRQTSAMQAIRKRAMAMAQIFQSVKDIVLIRHLFPITFLGKRSA
jgi:hypothetical protein